MKTPAGGGLTLLYETAVRKVEKTMAVPKKSSMKRRMAVAGAVAVVAVGCDGATTVEETPPPAEKKSAVMEGSPPTAVDLIGIWVQVADPNSLGVLVRFSPDGRFAIDDRGELATKAAAVGRYKIDGDTITFTSAGSDLCGCHRILLAKAAKTRL